MLVLLISGSHFIACCFRIFLILLPARRFCMGSNKVLRVALGHDASDEYRKNLSLLSENISGSVGLFFTSLPHEEVSLAPSLTEAAYQDAMPEIRWLIELTGLAD